MDGGSETVGEIKYTARIDTSTLAGDAKKAESLVSDAATGAERSVTESNSRISGSFGEVAGNVAKLAIAYQGIQNSKQFLTDSIDAADRMQASLLGLTSVSTAYGASATDAREAAKSLASDGLMSVTDAALGLKNLLASGFSLDQAIVLMNRFKDTAAFGRQSTLQFGQAISSATEGIKNGNEQLVDNAGVTKNLSTILEENGKTQQDVMNITSNASVRQALYNGLLKETSAQLGDASRLADTAAGSNARLDVTTNNLMAEVGQLANVIRQPLLGGLSTFIATNQQSIISIGAGVVAFAGMAAAAYLGVKAIGVLRTSLSLLAANPAVAVVSLLFGLFASDVVSRMTGDLTKAGDSMYDLGGATGQAADQTAGLTKQQEQLAKQLASIDDQIAKTNRDFTENLAQMVQTHEKTVKDLTQQITDNNRDYQKAYDDRLASFTDEQDKETETHQQKTLQLQAQIDFLRRYNNASNAQQLSDLQFSLARENAQYQQKVQDQKAQYDKDAGNAKASYDDKQTALQKQLADEQALLKKHAADVAAVRNVDLLDDIDKAKRSRDEQLKSLNQQKADALKNASDTASGVGAAYSGLGDSVKGGMKDAGQAAGKAMGDAFKKALGDAIKDMWKQLADLANNNDFAKWLQKQGYDYAHGNNSFAQFFQDMGRNATSFVAGHRAAGGPVSAGMPYAVGDNPDGSWNATTEVFVPKQSGTIVPASEVQRMVSGGGSAAPVHISVNLSGVMTSSRAEERALANRLIAAFNEGLRAKGLPEVGVAA